VEVHAFLNSALYEGEWSVSSLGHFIPGSRAPSTYFIRRYWGLGDSLDAVAKIKGPASTGN